MKSNNLSNYTQNLSGNTLIIANNNSIPNLLILESISADNGHDIVNLFAQFFFKNYLYPNLLTTNVLNSYKPKEIIFHFLSLLYLQS